MAWQTYLHWPLPALSHPLVSAEVNEVGYRAHNHHKSDPNTDQWPVQLTSVTTQEFVPIQTDQHSN